MTYYNLIIKDIPYSMMENVLIENAGLFLKVTLILILKKWSFRNKGDWISFLPLLTIYTKEYTAAHVFLASDMWISQTNDIISYVYIIMAIPMYKDVYLWLWSYIWNGESVTILKMNLYVQQYGIKYKMWEFCSIITKKWECTIEGCGY